MGTSVLKSTAIANFDATPYIPGTAGQGSPAKSRTVEGFVTAIAADAAGSTYQLVRIPSNAVVKAVNFRSEAQGAGKVQLSAYYSTSTIDGTAAAKQGLVVPTTGAGFFSDDIDCSAAVTPVDKLGTGTAPGWNISHWNKRLWDALGLTSDPGGFFDVVAVVHTTPVTTGTGRLGVSVDFTTP